MATTRRHRRRVDVLTKVRWASRFDDLAIGPSLEHDRFVTGPFAVGERANGLCALVFKSSEELVELLDAQGFQKPFSGRSMSADCRQQTQGSYIAIVETYT